MSAELLCINLHAHGGRDARVLRCWCINHASSLWLPFAIGALIGLPIGIRRLRRTVSQDRQRQAGHGRCAFCNTRLKAYAGQYATVCRKCGRTQPWAGQTPPPAKAQAQAQAKRSNVAASFSPDFHAD